MDDLNHVFIRLKTAGLHVVQAGPPAGPLVILLHGFPEFWYAWKAQIPALAQAGLQVWAPDQRGYNLSDKPTGIAAYQVDALVGDVLQLIEASGRQKATLVGHDWGAVVAWMAAIRRPERIEKLVILNVPHPAVMSRTVLSSPEQMLKSWYILAFQIPRLPELLARRNRWAAMVAALQSSSRPGTFSAASLERYRQAWGRPGAITGMLNWYRALVRLPLRLPASPRVRVPTLMLWGVKDVALSRQMARPSIELCDEGRLVFFESASHWVQHEEASLVNQYLVDFLKA